MSELSTIHVATGQPYDVTVGHGAVSGLRAAVGDAARVAILHPKVLGDEATALAHQLDAEVTQIQLPRGEKAKTAKVLDACWKILAEDGFTRTDAVVADPSVSGVALPHDHRRILATGMARLRATIQYRPVVFELLPDSFTLGELQACVEAVAGTRVHTQNFRRLIQQQHLVEETGEVDAGTGGRPARLFRFRREVHTQRQLVGTKLPIPRRR